MFIFVDGWRGGTTSKGQPLVLFGHVRTNTFEFENASPFAIFLPGARATPGPWSRARVRSSVSVRISVLEEMLLLGSSERQTQQHPTPAVTPQTIRFRLEPAKKFSGV